ncbi:adenosine deaminase [Micromonospora sp. NPDC007271]|uniref:adenosine deaminase n=1 Tax=Micromonospora sp. NPDC007271 TaxID=3154587 RepID=UPI0033D0A2A8
MLADVDDLIRAMPKVELHVHLEGSVQPETFLRLSRRNGTWTGLSDTDAVAELFNFRDLDAFLRLYSECAAVLRRPEDFVLVTVEMGLRAASQGIRYLEVTFSPHTHLRANGIPIDEQIDAVAAGAASVRRQTGTQLRFIMDHVRDYPLDECWRTAEWCVRGRDRGIAGLGLGGTERGRPASLFAPALTWAHEHGVPFVPHAGEAAGPDSVWDALAFAPTRIGHGFRAAEDPELLTVLRERQVVLEICPTSNLRTGTVSTPASHPLRRLIDAGVAVTLGTDDPAMFHTDLTAEYRLAVRDLGLTVKELAAANLAGIGAALLPGAERDRLAAEFRAEYRKLGLALPPAQTISI